MLASCNRPSDALSQDGREAPEGTPAESTEAPGTEPSTEETDAPAVDWVYIERDRTGGEIADLVILHGYGANERDLLPLAEQLDERLHIVLVRAPNELGDDRYAWYPLDWSSGSPVSDPADVQTSIESAAQELPALMDELGRTEGPLFVGGFSQGAILSVGMAIENPSAIDGVIALSGRAPPNLDEAAVSRVTGIDFFVSHGLNDDVIPIDEARVIRDLFSEHPDVGILYREYEMGHSVSPIALRDLSAWLGMLLDALRY